MLVKGNTETSFIGPVKCKKQKAAMYLEHNYVICRQGLKQIHLLFIRSLMT